MARQNHFDIYYTYAFYSFNYGYSNNRIISYKMIP